MAGGKQRKFWLGNQIFCVVLPWRELGGCLIVCGWVGARFPRPYQRVYRITRLLICLMPASVYGA
jgi:hypothetical protein